MKQTVTLHTFRDAFYKMGRKDQFSYDGLEILFDHIEEVEQDTGEEMELDVIALCCDYAETTIDDLISEFNIDISDCAPDDKEAIWETVMEYIQEDPSICGVTSAGTVVYEVF